MMFKTLLLVLALSVAAWALTMVLFSLLARRPGNHGIRDGRLAPCPATPNCVSSQDSDSQHAIEPLRFDDSPEEAWQRLKDLIATWPRMRLVSAVEQYLHAEAVSRIFRFVDDVEFLLDREGKQIHVRSASRAGKSDLSVNRRRMEAIREAF